MRRQSPDDFFKHLRRVPTTWDFYCPEAKHAIECDGLLHFTPEGIEKDRFRTKWRRRQGIEVIRFTNTETENDMQRVLFGIDSAIKRRLGQHSPPHPPTPSPPEEEKGSWTNNRYAMLPSWEHQLRKPKLLKPRTFNTPA